MTAAVTPTTASAPTSPFTAACFPGVDCLNSQSSYNHTRIEFSYQLT